MEITICPQAAKQKIILDALKPLRLVDKLTGCQLNLRWYVIGNHYRRFPSVVDS